MSTKGKLGRNFRVNGSSSAKSTRYMTGRGPSRHEARTALNCGCDIPSNHSRSNRATHEKERQLAANASRQARAQRDNNPALLAPRGKRGPARQPSLARLSSFPAAAMAAAPIASPEVTPA